jgi:DNA-binding response OmpR family regulator
MAHLQALDPGVAYLPKPFSTVQLAVKVREVLSEQ